MAKPSDPTIKTLVEITPGDWLKLTGHRLAPTRVIDADVGTIRGAADKVILVEDTPRYLLHLDFQAGHDSAKLPPRLRLYNSVMDDRHAQYQPETASEGRPSLALQAGVGRRRGKRLADRDRANQKTFAETADRRWAADIWAATYVLLGLRYSESVA